MLVIAGKPEAGFRDVGVRCGTVAPGAYVAEVVRHVERVEDLSRIKPTLPIVVRQTSHAPHLLAANEEEGIGIPVVIGCAISECLAIGVGTVRNPVVVSLTDRETRSGIV